MGREGGCHGKSYLSFYDYCDKPLSGKYFKAILMAKKVDILVALTMQHKFKAK